MDNEEKLNQILTNQQAMIEELARVRVFFLTVASLGGVVGLLFLLFGGVPYTEDIFIIIGILTIIVISFLSMEIIEYRKFIKSKGRKK